MNKLDYYSLRTPLAREESKSEKDITASPSDKIYELLRYPILNSENTDLYHVTKSQNTAYFEYQDLEPSTFMTSDKDEVLKIKSFIAIFGEVAELFCDVLSIASPKSGTVCKIIAKGLKKLMEDSGVLLRNTQIELWREL